MSAPASHAPASHAPASHAPASHAPASHGPASHAPASHAPASHGPAARAGLAVVSVAPDAAVMLQALPVACVMVSPDGRFRYANQAAEQFFGLSMTQLRTLALHDLLGADTAVFALIERVRNGESMVSEHDLAFDTLRLQKAGVTVQAAGVPEDPGCVILVLLQKAGARTLDRQMSFRKAARSVAGMAAVLAHEVKNPLSGIRGAAQLLEHSVAEADRELAVLIRDEADRIGHLVDRMEAFGEKPIRRDAVNIHRVLEHVRRLAQTGFAAHLRLNEDYDPSLPPVLGDRDQLVQVLLNLVKNAAEALSGSGRGGEITLLTAYQDGVRLTLPGTKRRRHLPLVVTVRDTGPGIAPELRETLFDPFVTSKPSGTGLGLALVAKIIGEHGGLIEVDSRPGRTDVRLFLPIFQEDQDVATDRP